MNPDSSVRNMKIVGSNDRYCSSQNDFETFNASNIPTREDEKSHKQILLQEAINIHHYDKNPMRNSKNTEGKSLNAQNLDYNSDRKNRDINHSVPLVISGSKLNNSGSERESHIPTWATGMRRMPTFEENGLFEDKLYSQQLNENLINKIISKLERLEHRMNNADEKIRITKEITTLKYDEKKLESHLGKNINIKHL